MSELIFMPTPNWFIPRPIAISNNGLIAISAINSILIANDFFNEYNYAIKDAHSKRIHSLALYRFISNNAPVDLIASCSEDLDVKVWNIQSRCLFNQHKLHQNPPSCIDWLNSDLEQKENEPLLISCDIKGNIFKWNIITGQHVRYFPENKPITQVRSHPNIPIIAAGYKQGGMVIMDVKHEQMKILHKLKNHEDSINFLYWFPINELKSESDIKGLELVYKTNDLSMVLCSSSEDKTIRFWCASKGVQLKQIKAPGVNTSSSSKATQIRGQQTAKINYTPLCWPNPRIIISGSFKGELCYHSLLGDNNEQDRNTKWQIFSTLSSEKSHKKIIYEINFYKDTIITISLDRLINLWNLKTLKQYSSITTLNGYVYSIAGSPIDPNILAISVGDSSIKILNQKDNNKFAKNFNNNIKSEVTQIRWHPNKESIIALGLKDGKVGIADIFSNKPVHYVYTEYNQSIYTLLWNESLIPDVNQGEMKKSTNLHLYSVSDGKIMFHKLQQNSVNSSILNSVVKTFNFYKELMKFMENDKLNENKSDQAANIQDVNNNKFFSNKESENYGLTEFSIIKIESLLASNDYYFAIGKFDGSIEFFQTKYKDQKVIRLCKIFNHQKLVSSLKWNANLYSNNFEKPIMIATGSNDFNVIIVDFKSLVKEIENRLELGCNHELKYFSKYKHKLIGHKERITDLSWSSKNDVEILASCSYDSTVQIWNANHGTPIANFRGHSDKLLCCMFSTLDSNIVYSGGEDYCLIKWKIDLQSDKTPPEECAMFINKKKSKSIKKFQTKKDSEKIEIDTQRKDTINEAAKTTLADLEEEQIDMIVEKEETLCIDGHIMEIEDTSTKIISSFGKASKKVIKPNSQKEIKSLFLLSSHGGKSQKSKLFDCLNLFENLYEKQPLITSHIKKTSFKDLSHDFDFCKFDFGKDRINLNIFGNRLSTLEMLSLEQAELKRLNYDRWWIFEVWRGNIINVINELKQENNLNDTLISLHQISFGLNDISKSLLYEYIDHLSKQSADQINKAVLFALTLFDVKKAIEIYLSNNLFQYALCVAQLRLPPAHSLLLMILNKYAIYATNTGDYETAVLCYIRTGDFENAFKVLIRRNSKNDNELESLLKNLLKKLANFIPELEFV